MKLLLSFLIAITLIACKQKDTKETAVELPSEEQLTAYDLTIVFASCNDQDRPQPLWRPIIENQPDLYIWGGDNIYADTEDMEKMKADYDKVWANQDYVELSNKTKIVGTWDDHDYGGNDVGAEWKVKDEAQQLFLDFLKVDENDPIRKQEGVYSSEMITTDAGALKVILLDTRYFRSPLKKSTKEGHRYEPWDEADDGSILGEAQWQWLENELKDDSANFTLLVTSIQFLSEEHGYEKWANFPKERAKMYSLLQRAKAQNVIMLSGDLHQAEFSVNENAGTEYPLIDFTTSGLTHTYPEMAWNSNKYRVGEGTKVLNFGVLKFDFNNKKALMEIRTEGNELVEDLMQQY